MNKIQIFYEGDHIFEQGDCNRDIYLVKEGEVRIYQEINGKEIDVTIVGPGDIFGEMAFIDHSPRSASAIAKTNARIFVIREASMENILEGNPIWFKAIIRVLISRLRETTTMHNFSTAFHPITHLKNYVEQEYEKEVNPEDIVKELSNHLSNPEYSRLCNVLNEALRKR